MSIKKLGGIRLRLIAGMTATMAVCGVVFAYMLTPSIEFSPDSTNEGEEALLLFDDLASDTYFLVPKNRESHDDLTGWKNENDQSGDGEEGTGYIFDTQVGYINLGTLSGSGAIFIKTEDILTIPDTELTSMELRKGTVGGTLVGPADMTLLAQ